MSSGQKVLKILAMILAVFIIVSICSAILFGITLFSGIMYSSKHSDNGYREEMYTDEIVEENIDKIEQLSENVKLKIDLETCNLEVRKGEKFQVQKVNTSTNVKYKVIGNTLEIKEKNSNWFKPIEESSSTVIVYVPEDCVLEEFEASIGIGIADIKDVKTKKLDIDAGAGKTTLSNIVAEKTEIDGGAGNFAINDSILTNLDLDCGVGVTTIHGDIKGNSKISCGVGKTELHLIQAKENYRIRTEIGIGEITLNGERCTSDVYGNGDSYIKIDGGVGKVEITTK